MKKVESSNLIVLDGLLICNQNVFQFSPPEGPRAKILKIALWAKTILAPTFFQNFFAFSVVSRYNLDNIKKWGGRFSSKRRNLENCIFHLLWSIMTCTAKLGKTKTLGWSDLAYVQASTT